MGGAVKEDYVFRNLSGGETKLSELFGGNSANLLIYSFMYKSGGNACPACTSLLDSLNGAAPHIKQNLNFAVIAKASVDELSTWAGARNWSNLTILSSGRTTYNLDYKSEDDEESQLPMMNVFRKSDDGIFHTWASEMFYAPNDDGQHPRHADQIWPLWSVYDLTPDGRPSDWFPSTSYD